MTNEEALLRDYWERVLCWARKKSDRVPYLLLRIDCPLVRRTRKTSPRAFMHAAHIRGKVCVAREAARLSAETIIGLFLHEIGHQLATRSWGRSEQEDADRAVNEFLGVKIRYKGDLLLEWVPAHVAVRILGI